MSRRWQQLLNSLGTAPLLAASLLRLADSDTPAYTRILLAVFFVAAQAGPRFHSALLVGTIVHALLPFGVPSAAMWIGFGFWAVRDQKHPPFTRNAWICAGILTGTGLFLGPYLPLSYSAGLLLAAYALLTARSPLLRAAGGLGTVAAFALALPAFRTPSPALFLYQQLYPQLFGFYARSARENHSDSPYGELEYYASPLGDYFIQSKIAWFSDGRRRLVSPAYQALQRANRWLSEFDPHSSLSYVGIVTSDLCALPQITFHQPNPIGRTPHCGRIMGDPRELLQTDHLLVMAPFPVSGQDWLAWEKLPAPQSSRWFCGQFPFQTTGMTGITPLTESAQIEGERFYSLDLGGAFCALRMGSEAARSASKNLMQRKSATPP